MVNTGLQIRDRGKPIPTRPGLSSTQTRSKRKPASSRRSSVNGWHPHVFHGPNPLQHLLKLVHMFAKELKNWGLGWRTSPPFTKDTSIDREVVCVSVPDRGRDGKYSADRWGVYLTW